MIIRCVDIRDKSLAIGINVIFCALFAFLPSPLVYGKIIDGACSLWQTLCGDDTGNCVTYDLVQFRTRFMFTTSVFMSLGVISDILVWYESKDLVVFRENKINETEIIEKINIESEELLEGNEQHEENGKNDENEI